MAKNNKKGMGLESLGGLIYSTNSDFQPENNDEELEETPLPEKQKLFISLDKKQRGGKKVTLIEGYLGHDDDLAELSKQLKKLCGVGGSAKNGEILVQGDFRDKIFEFLQKERYQVKRKGG